MIISLIAAYNLDSENNRVIGKDNTLPWHSSSDLKRFREYTSGCPIVMGRKTHESIGRVLPNRTNIIVSRQLDYTAPGALVFPSIDEALYKAEALGAEVFIIGGGEIFKQTIDRAERLYITKMKKVSSEGDTFFPNFEKQEFRILLMEDSETELFRIMERNRPTIYPDESGSSAFLRPGGVGI